jgi:hypothetical protein
MSINLGPRMWNIYAPAYGLEGTVRGTVCFTGEEKHVESVTAIVRIPDHAFRAKGLYSRDFVVGGEDDNYHTQERYNGRSFRPTIALSDDHTVFISHENVQLASRSFLCNHLSDRGVHKNG